ncbi:hypothetical protein [Spirulina sp. 06S082]|uniref:hypothetical protein n=1 Tax=Spirulina sp. 06S082 TaxID=3110248 RepID=UPI002B1FC23B|nr:hypothetical protein [Spirulina sp. 06S082]MEA5468002.1 hypothetical protein [Spirulina sp. 06S082]
MKITSIRYGHTHNTGNFESDRLDLDAQLDNEDNLDESYQELRKLVRSLLGADLKDEIRDLEKEIWELRAEEASMQSTLLEANKQLEVINMEISRKETVLDPIAISTENEEKDYDDVPY